jgi:hypothetical protein
MFQRDQAVTATREIRFNTFAIPAGALGYVEGFAHETAGPFSVRFILPARFTKGANVQFTVEVASDEIVAWTNPATGMDSPARIRARTEEPK